jgi:hypothetical protein
VPSRAQPSNAVGSAHRRRVWPTPADPLAAAGLVDDARAPCPHPDPMIGIADIGRAETDLAVDVPA